MGEMTRSQTTGSQNGHAASAAPQALWPAHREELIMHLERDQLVAETSRPLPPARLGRFTTAALWTLRTFVLLVGLMVIYTFALQLH